MLGEIHVKKDPLKIGNYPCQSVNVMSWNKRYIFRFFPNVYTRKYPLFVDIKLIIEIYKTNSGKVNVVYNSLEGINMQNYFTFLIRTNETKDE